MDLITVPQFIDNEDKILGPITVRQFVIMLVTGGILFVIFKLSDLSLFILSAILIGGTGALFAFYRVNGQPFHFFLLHIFQTVRNPSLRVWKRDTAPVINIIDEESGHDEVAPRQSRMSEQRLSDLSLIVDTGGAYKGHKDEGFSN